MEEQSGRRGREIVVLHEDEALRVRINGDREDPGVFLCFTGVGGGAGGLQMDEFVGSTQMPGYFGLYITDKLRRWYNEPPETLLSVLAPVIAGKQVITIGNSMGGFGAIWMAGLLGTVRTCLAFSPQYSVHPEIVPGEKRWQGYRKEIKSWRVPSLLDSFAPATRFWTFNGGADVEHWSKFPHGDHLTHFVSPDAGHDVARVLKDAGVLTDAMRDCVEGVDPAARIAAAGVLIERIEPGRGYADLKEEHIRRGKQRKAARKAKSGAEATPSTPEERQLRRAKRKSRREAGSDPEQGRANREARRAGRAAKPDGDVA